MENELLQKQKRFIRNFVIQSAMLLVLAGAAVIVFDPFFHYHKPIGSLKAVVTKAEYQCIGTVRNLDYDSILLGSSVAENYNNRWFDEAFGGKTIKGIKSSAATVDLVYYLKEAFAAKEDTGIREVYYSMDLFALSADAERVFPDASMPLYLYNKNPVDDVNYVWNKDVIFEHIPYLLAMTYLDDYDEGTSYNWAQYKVFSREETLSHYSRQEEIAPMLSEETYRQNIDANISMIEEVVKEHPETKFRFIYPPYSMLWWDAAYRNGETEQNLYAAEKAAERLLAYENVELYYFQNDEELITDLDNYMDIVHFSDEINHYIVEQMKEGNDRLTEENYRQEMERMRELTEKIETEYVGEYFEN